MPPQRGPPPRRHLQLPLTDRTPETRHDEGGRHHGPRAMEMTVPINRVRATTRRRPPFGQTAAPGPEPPAARRPGAARQPTIAHTTAGADMDAVHRGPGLEPAPDRA